MTILTMVVQAYISLGPSDEAGSQAVSTREYELPADMQFLNWVWHGDVVYAVTGTIPTRNPLIHRIELLDDGVFRLTPSFEIKGQFSLLIDRDRLLCVGDKQIQLVDAQTGKVLVSKAFAHCGHLALFRNVEGRMFGHAAAHERDGDLCMFEIGLEPFEVLPLGAGYYPFVVDGRIAFVDRDDGFSLRWLASNDDDQAGSALMIDGPVALPIPVAGGNAIVFQIGHIDRSIGLLNLESGEVKLLSGSDKHCAWPAVSGDGELVAFACCKTGLLEDCTVRVATLDGTIQFETPSKGRAVSVSYRWEFGGDRLATITAGAKGSTKLTIVDFDGE